MVTSPHYLLIGYTPAELHSVHHTIAFSHAPSAPSGDGRAWASDCRARGGHGVPPHLLRLYAFNWAGLQPPAIQLRR